MSKTATATPDPHLRPRRWACTSDNPMRKSNTPGRKIECFESWWKHLRPYGKRRHNKLVRREWARFLDSVETEVYLQVPVTHHQEDRT